MNLKAHIGIKVRSERRKAGLTQEKLGNLSAQGVAALENDRFSDSRSSNRGESSMSFLSEIQTSAINWLDAADAFLTYAADVSRR